MRKRERHQPWWPRQVRGWKPGEHRKDFSLSSSWKMLPETFLKIGSYFQKRTFPGARRASQPHMSIFFPTVLTISFGPGHCCILWPGWGRCSWQRETDGHLYSSQLSVFHLSGGLGGMG